MLSRLKDLDVSSIMEWSPTDKGVMISYVSILICLWDALVVGALYSISELFDLSPQHAVTSFGFYFTVILASVYALVCVIMAYAGAKLKDGSDNQQTWYMYACMAIYVIGNALIILLFGALSMATGVLLAGSPIIGWILFDKRGVIYSIVIGTAMVMMGFLLAFFGIIPFVLLIDADYGIYNNISYNVAMFCAVLPHTLSLLYLAYVAIFQWKSREAQINHLAHTDSLTKVANRRQIDQRLTDAVKKNKGWLSVLMFDIDHFKAINDNHGHSAGDKILNQVIIAIKSVIRDQDVIGRFGGDEFMLLLPNTQKSSATLIGQRCLEVVRKVSINHQNHKLSVTVSFGLKTIHYSAYDATTEDVHTTVEQLINEADAALYRAKAAGRDRLVLA